MVGSVGEQIFQDELLTPGSVHTLWFWVPLSIPSGSTYARFRISTQSGLAPDGSASDGEVEDYQVEIGGPYDWGDLPDTGFGTGPGNYQTLQSDGGAVHDLSVVGPFMGATVDGEVDGQPGWLADGDDLDGWDDEDGITFTSPLTPGRSASVDVDMGASPMSGVLNAWIDFDGDGQWSGAGEQIFQDELLTPGSVHTLWFWVPQSIPWGSTYACFRISTQSGLAPDGSASDGEVEDYQVEIGGPYDWGDLPDTDPGTGPGNYQTLQSHNGAVHDLSVVGPFMGATVDGEVDGQPGWLADGDDLDGWDDEDGITFTSPLTPGRSASVDVDMGASPMSGVLNAWIDFDGDGQWSGVGEQIFQDEWLTPGSVHTLWFWVPQSIPWGSTYARFRISTQSGLAPDGSASDGEVEDYQVEIGGPYDWALAPPHGAGPALPICTCSSRLQQVPGATQDSPT